MIIEHPASDRPI